MARRRNASAEATGSGKASRYLFAGFGAALLVAGLAWGGQKLFEPATLPLKSVRVPNSLQRVTQEELREAILPHVNKGFLGLDMPAVRRSVESLPWVRRVSVRRHWPDTLEVRVEEQQPLARWADKGLINRDGELFSPPADQIPADLPVLEGPEQTQAELAEKYTEMQRILGAVGLRIIRLTMSARRAWDLRLDNGLVVVLGREEAYPRLLRFVRVFPAVLKAQMEHIERVDLRYTNGFAVRWRAGHAPAQV